MTKIKTISDVQVEEKEGLEDMGGIKSTAPLPVIVLL